VKTLTSLARVTIIRECVSRYISYCSALKGAIIM
jgi:hypothetical protein